MLFVLKMAYVATLLKMPEENKLEAGRLVRNNIMLATIHMRTMSA